MQVLVVENDAVLADCLTEALLDNGHMVCGVASSIADAVGLARQHRPDVAIVEMFLHDKERGSDIADQLTESGDLGRTGVLYVSGEAERVIREARIGHACLRKPYTLSALDSALEIVREIAREGGTSRILPRGLRLMRPAEIGAQPAI